MSLPIINILLKNTIHAFPEDGNLVFKYSPLQNLKNITVGGAYNESDVGPLNLPASKANIDITGPITLDTEVSYDTSVNLIVNDHKNPLKLVNSRFYLTDSWTYKIGDRRGNVDTNIYTEDNFKIESALIKSVRSVITLDFEGIYNGGKMPVGSYNFYFKLADGDGNETDFISESGKVVCHIGTVNQPSSIRGGLLDEDSNKIIKFKLNNLDLAYDYINIYYTRNTGDEVQELIKAYKITDKFKIDGVSTKISITGYEEHEEIDINEINLQYASFDMVETTANCQNMMFAGNITRDYDVFKILEKYSLLITPQLAYTEDIGNLNQNYLDNSPDDGCEYFNAKNIYYKLGLWNEDIYRMGIVYIMNDYTLSPVFNIRGITTLYDNVSFYSYNIQDTINYGEDFILEKFIDKTNLENSKGVFKINSSTKIFQGGSAIKPIGIKFNFTGSVLSGIPQLGVKGLKDYTKGFFIVRQKRIPTLLTQAIGIATASKTYTPIIKGTYGTTTISNDYFSESFLTADTGKPKLGRDIFKVTEIKNNALLCPEATLKSKIYNNFFNSSEFTLKKFNHTANPFFSDTAKDRVLFNLGNLNYIGENNNRLKTSLLLVESEINLINNGSSKFCSRSGDPLVAWKHTDPVLGNLEDMRVDTEIGNISDTSWSESATKVRGDFNTFIGTDIESLEFGQYYNIFQKDYDFENNWKNYFRVRYNDSSAFMAVSDRMSWEGLTTSTPTIYRGDCYINTFTQRMLWNFIDPELPTNKNIIDPWTWYKNYRVKKTRIKSLNGNVVDDTAGSYTDTAVEFEYKKVLDLFTYRTLVADDDNDTLALTSVQGLVTPDARKYKKYSEINGVFGAEKINRPDVNAVPIGHWVTFKICSNINLAMRDIDDSLPEEEAVHKVKRSFYPLQSAKPSNKLPESKIINSGISKALSNKLYFEIPDVPFITTSFTNRIYYSEILQESTFKNGNRVFKADNFQDYSGEYGALVKLVEWYGKLIAVMEHGVLMIPVNERAMMTNAQGENVYINTENVLPKNPAVLSNTYGSVWIDGIVTTPRFIYGIDTIGKKIWRTNGEKFEIISDMKIQKFLNDNIHLKVSERLKIPGTNSIKAHFNAFKQDVLFVFKYGTTKWHLCWNELLNKWTTQYSWFPEFSENINNIFYTFANKSIYQDKGNILYKHGFAGGIEESGIIEPTKWYDIQEPFELEFVVIGVQGVQKIFDNLKIISNLVAPQSFEYEIVGEGYDWNVWKNNIIEFNNELTENEIKANYLAYLQAHPTVKKIPYIWVRNTNIQSVNWPDNVNVLKDLTLREHNKTKEKLVKSYQKGVDIKTSGRIKGNMQYVEDFWDVQIQPISFKYAYLKNNVLTFSNFNDMKIRDKYLKIRIKYNGEQYVIINALKTLFTISYA